MARNGERTSWGDHPGKPIESTRVTRRDVAKIAGKAAIGVIAISGGVHSNNEPDVNLETRTRRRP
ncbi:hypothetical protein [Frankia sp. AgB32]|uniref:hypothetical protein n=1 Tax=Frankia sp. AgB32 TaxID=631119 RepID=UPI00200C0A95|nr:hypothetical protein [Frankia sp. AgB32]MCK9898380.1 hypothetical protein [Frankia sp. AgB32]